MNLVPLNTKTGHSCFQSFNFLVKGFKLKSPAIGEFPKASLLLCLFVLTIWGALEIEYLRLITKVID